MTNCRSICSIALSLADNITQRIFAYVKIALSGFAVISGLVFAAHAQPAPAGNSSFELVEVFEAGVGRGWNCGYSHGEGSSRVIANDIYSRALPPGFVTAPKWSDETPPGVGGVLRDNWVDRIDPEDTNKFSVGCSVLFLNWLRWVEHHSWESIIQAGGDTLAETYGKLPHLTPKSPKDAWPTFKTFIDRRYPLGSPSNLKDDNPFRPKAGVPEA